MTKSWLYSANEKTYTITLSESLTTWREVKINGKIVLDEALPHNLASNYEFTFDGISFRLAISRGYFIIRRTYDLYANDNLIPPNNQ